MDKFKNEVERFNKIYIQMHNIPDADAIASAQGVQALLRSFGKESTIIYYGEIKKPSLMHMQKVFNLELIAIGKNFTIAEDALLILVDCQYGESNVVKIETNNVISLDHHNPKYVGHNYLYSDIRTKVGSCSAIVAEYIDYYKAPLTVDLATSLYFGIKNDTNGFLTNFTNFDREIKDLLETSVNMQNVILFDKSSLTLEDMRLVSKTMASVERYGNIAFASVGDCDDNLMGHITDPLTDVDGIDIVILYSERKEGYKLSIRSLHEYISAEEIAIHLTENIGNGGGRDGKAGGFISQERFVEQHENICFDIFLKNKTINYCNSLRHINTTSENIFSAIKHELFQVARKRKVKVTVVELEDLFKNTEDFLIIKTLEGDIKCTAEDNLVIGIAGEPYSITKKTLTEKYELYTGKHVAMNNYIIDERYGIRIQSNDMMHIIDREKLEEVGKTYISRPLEAEVYKVETRTKLKTRWGYMLANKGDYIIVDVEKNAYVCSKDLFHKLYEIIR